MSSWLATGAYDSALLGQLCGRLLFLSRLLGRKKPHWTPVTLAGQLIKLPTSSRLLHYLANSEPVAKTEIGASRSSSSAATCSTQDGPRSHLV